MELVLEDLQPWVFGAVKVQSSLSWEMVVEVLKCHILVKAGEVHIPQAFVQSKNCPMYQALGEVFALEVVYWKLL